MATRNSCEQGKGFHKDAAHLAEQLVPQHRAILDAKSLEGRQHGQATCRDMRSSVMHSLPHRPAPLPLRRSFGSIETVS